MKSDKEWAAEIIGDSPELWGEFPERVRRIQIDALEHAADVIAESSHPFRELKPIEIQFLIIQEADKLRKPNG